jgi:hypothetical protein
MPNSLALIPALALVLCFGTIKTASAETVQEVTTGIKSEKKNFFSILDLNAEYRVVSDLNQDVSPQSYSNVLELTASRDLWTDYIGSVTTGVQWNAEGAAVVRNSKNDDFFNFADINLALLHTLHFRDGKQNFSFILDEDILTSEDSRYLGYYSVTFAQVVSTTKFSSWLSLKNTLTGGYFANRYKFSPISYDQTKVGDINADGMYAYAITPLLRITKGLIFAAVLSVRGTHYIDQSNTYDFGNSYILSYSLDNWSLYAKYINRGWADRGETNLWYVDQYRRLGELGVSVNF